MNSKSSKKRNYYLTSLGLEVLSLCADTPAPSFEDFLEQEYGKSDH